MIRPTNNEYDNLRPFLANAPARLQERVIALIGSWPIVAGYSWTEEIGENKCRWHGLAIVGRSVLRIDLIAPAYRLFGSAVGVSGTRRWGCGR